MGTLQVCLSENSRPTTSQRPQRDVTFVADLELPVESEREASKQPPSKPTTAESDRRAEPLRSNTAPDIHYEHLQGNSPGGTSKRTGSPTGRTDSQQRSRQWKQAKTTGMSSSRTTTEELGKKLPTFPPLSLLHNIMPVLWRRKLDSPLEVLRALQDVTFRLLPEKSVVVTVYMLDPWLRQECETGKDAGSTSSSPTVFYMGQGKQELQVLQQDGVRPAAPCFDDLAKLPARARKFMATQLQMPVAKHRVGVLQVQHVEDKRKTDQPDATHDSFTESQMMCLQLVCAVAGGLLEQQEDSMAQREQLGRYAESVNVATGLNKARSLPDFEQLVKCHLGTFFRVNAVRVLFYDHNSEKLLVSSAQMAHTRRKECMAISQDKGIVGLCARRKEVLHIPNVSLHPYVDVVADGLQRQGKQIGAHAAMLCGPMVVDYDEGSRLVGVVQLMERTKVKRASKGDDMRTDFTAEEEQLFTQLLRVLAHCALRTLKVQAMALQLSDGSRQAPTLQKLMMAG